MLDISKINKSCFDKKRGIVLPQNVSEDLAYLCGIMAGDGHISHNGKGYYLLCDGHKIDEKENYDKIIAPLFYKIFHLRLKARDHGTTYGIAFGSRAIFEFLTKIMGLPNGVKYDSLRIPKIFKDEPKHVTAFIQGVADTDFVISLKKRYRNVAYYPVVTGISKSKSFMEEIAQELEKRGLKVIREFNVVQQDSRFKAGFAITHRVHLNGHSQLIKWMQKIGFRSFKHLKKFKLWKERNRGRKLTQMRISSEGWI